MTCFFVSGVAGLVYQVAWSRYLALFLGHTSYAVVAVLVAFMGGLAVGNALLGPAADRTSKPLALYGWLEIGIAVYAAIFPWYYEICDNLYISAARHFTNSGGAPLLLLKFVFSFMTVIIPTTLMGATFPALTRFVTNSLAELRERVASLYFINSLGAVAGCFVADFWWIPQIGLEFTVYGAAALNFLAGIVALGMSRSLLEGTSSQIKTVEAAEAAPIERFSASDIKIATIAIGASGFVAMLYEVAWTRLLALALGSSTHAFSIMLITFITGIAIGAAVVAKWGGLKKTMDAFGWAEIALGVTVLLSMFAYEALPFWFVKIGSLLARKAEAYPVYELMQGLICFLVMFVPAVCLGMTLPLASRIATAELARTGRSVGIIFAVNTLGTVLGAAVTGLFLMPHLGLAGTFALGFVLNILIGLAILYRNRMPRLHAPLAVAVVAVAFGFVVIARAHFEPLWRSAFIQGVWRTRRITTFENFRLAGSSNPFRYYKDGAGSTVGVISAKANPRDIAMRVNGKTDASSGDMGTQLMLGHLPALMHTKATNALVVGLGSGMTPGAMLHHTNLLSVRCIEISPEIAEAAPIFEEFNNKVMESPRFHLALEDAKSFLRGTTERFDIIVNEPSNPWMAGVASVFSQEFYVNCLSRLNDDGVMVQWVQIYETADETLQTVVKTFASVFPFVSVWRAQQGDLILVGTPRPRKVDLAAFLERMGDPAVSQDMWRGAFSNPHALLLREILAPQNGAYLATERSLIHSDFYPTLEYMSQVGFFVGGIAGLHDTVDETSSPRAETLLAEFLRRQPMTANDFRLAAQASLESQFVDERRLASMFEHWAVVETNTTLPMEMIERLKQPRPAALTEELRLLPRHDWIMQQGRTDITALHFYERALMRAYRTKRSILYLPDTTRLDEVLKTLLERDAEHKRVFTLHAAELAWDRGDDETAVRLGLSGLNPDPQYGPLQYKLDQQAPHMALANLINYALRVGDLRQAVALAEQARKAGDLVKNELFYAPLDFYARKAQVLSDAMAEQKDQGAAGGVGLSPISANK